MKKLLIINCAQFGYHVDSYKYCQYLKDKFEITYICFDSGKDKVEEGGINIIYIPCDKSFIKRGISFIKACRSQIKNENYDLVFIVYLLMSSFIKIGFKKENFILDIRTGSVDQNSKKRFIENTVLKLESLFFKNLTIISECLRKKLKLDNEKCHILPLGSDPISSNKKHFNDLNLLYVGTLNGREIEKTVLGLANFLKIEENNNIQNKIKYDIIGFGTEKNEDILRHSILESNLNDIVKFHGRKKHNELEPYFNKANIGISYIPIVEHYQCQPPTKTFEYINSGLFCIATSTNIHNELISKDNGLLCLDNAESFAESLNKLKNIRTTINGSSISSTLKKYYWKTIVHKNLQKYLENINDKI